MAERTRKPYRLRKRGRTWYAMVPGGKWKSTGQTVEAKAAREALRWNPAASGGLTLREYAAPYFTADCPHAARLREERKRVGLAYQRNMRRVLDMYVLVDPIADMHIDTIRRGHVLDLRRRLFAALPDHPGVVNRAMGAVKVVLKEGLFREEIQSDPTSGIGNIKESYRSRGVFTWAELADLFPEEGLGPWGDAVEYAAYSLAAFAGLRGGEIRALRWGNVDLDGAQVDVCEAFKLFEGVGLPKWEKTRTVPLGKRIMAALRRVQDEGVHTNPGDYVVTYDDGKSLGIHWWRNRFRAAMGARGIDAAGRHLSPHAFRHTLQTLLAAGGADAVRLRAMLGWSSERVQANYTHLGADNLRSLADAIDESLTAG